MKALRLFGTASVALLWATTALAATTCKDVLASNSYDCSFVGENASQDMVCAVFTTPGTTGDFDLHIGGFGLDAGCSCLPTGSFTNPHWDASHAFDCVATNTVISGKAAGKKLSGHSTANNGFNELFKCTLRTTPCP